MLRSKGKNIPIFFTTDHLKDLDLESAAQQIEPRKQKIETIDYKTLFQSQVKLTKRDSHPIEKVFQGTKDLSLKKIKESPNEVMTLDYNKILFGGSFGKGSQILKGNTQATQHTQEISQSGLLKDNLSNVIKNPLNNMKQSNFIPEIPKKVLFFIFRLNSVLYFSILKPLSNKNIRLHISKYLNFIFPLFSLFQ